MKYAKTSYPIGATWQVKDKSKIYKIWLFERHDNGMEIWRFGSVYNDGSGSSFDWTTSYKSARKNLYTDKRMKRIK